MSVRKKNLAKKSKIAKNKGPRGGALTGDRVDVHPLSAMVPYSEMAIGIPAQKMVEMRYVEVLNLSSTVAAFNTYRFAANGLYDPNISGAGHQPYGFDQWMTFYNSATVLESRIDVEATSSYTSMALGVTFSRTDPTSLALIGCIEANRGTCALVCPGLEHRYVQSTFDLKRVYPDFDPGSVLSTTSSNPTFTYPFTVYTQTLDGISTSVAQCIVVLTYKVLLQDPINVATS